MKTHVLGFPRMGDRRELKWALEKYWRSEIEAKELQKTAANIRKQNWQRQQKAGIDMIPSNDFSFYDQMLDMSALLGGLPKRFDDEDALENYFLAARGKNRTRETQAMEMTKWFDTNYHYLVPEFEEEQVFSLSSDKIFKEYQEAKKLGIETMPVLIGPMTYIYLGKIKGENFDQWEITLNKILPVYRQILSRLNSLGVKWIQIDEPIFSLDLPNEILEKFAPTYSALKEVASTSKILINNYFGAYGNNLETAFNLSADGWHFDLQRGNTDLPQILNKFPKNRVLSAGLVNGRNIWTNDYEASNKVIDKLKSVIPNLWLSTSCSLLHSPVSLKGEEEDLDSEILSWLSFADEKLIEVVELASGDITALEANQAKIKSYRESERVHNQAVKERVKAITPNMFKRNSVFAERIKTQQTELDLPLFPTTTIGSFPQTNEIRAAHKKGRKGGDLSPELVEFCKQEIDAPAVIIKELSDVCG